MPRKFDSTRRSILKAIAASAAVSLSGLKVATRKVEPVAAATLVGQILSVFADGTLVYLIRSDSGFLPADGRMVPRALYPELFSALQDAYGKDDDDRFVIPDLRGQVMRVQS